jgi:hypothetical protein
MITTNKMNVGILTYHEGLNHGAYLQAFATMRVLQEMGHDVEIINYKNKQHRFMEDVQPWFKYRRPDRFVDRVKKQHAFSLDQQQLSTSAYTTDPTDLKTLNYDVLVVGSDVVWNYKIFGYDETYFGGVPANRKISYAPSFGWVNADESHPARMYDDLKRFDAISVRDENSSKIIKSLYGYAPAVVLDPTLIYDFKDDERQSVWPKRLGNYLMVYAYTVEPSTISRVRTFAEQNGLTIVATGYRERWCDKNLMGVGPLEWLNMYRHADTILTSTFHGTVYALKNKKKFFYIANDKAKNRVLSLLDMCGIETGLPDLKDGDCELIDPDYTVVSPRLASAAKVSVAWLEKELKG